MSYVIQPIMNSLMRRYILYNTSLRYLLNAVNQFQIYQKYNDGLERGKPCMEWHSGFFCLFLFFFKKGDASLVGSNVRFISFPP